MAIHHVKFGEEIVETSEDPQQDFEKDCLNEVVESRIYCAVCSIKFNSADDHEFSKTCRQSRGGEWVGCEQQCCDYWAHAQCAKLRLRKGQKVDSIQFYCPKHNSRKKDFIYY